MYYEGGINSLISVDSFEVTSLVLREMNRSIEPSQLQLLALSNKRGLDG